MAFESRYSLLDRTIHRLAFATRAAQVAISEFENRLFSRRLSSCAVERPVFITSLPRAGTTLLLECLATSQEFAAHSYRDMPFTLVPLLWSQLTHRHYRAEEKRERAHGDGVAVDADSPEALDETLWTTFWKSHYLRDRILPWTDAGNTSFTEFYRAHIRKIIVLRRGTATGSRYLCKNNANIARLRLVRRMFRDATIIVPFREPLSHAASLLRQHENFLQIQAAEPFALEYMSGIGHHDFGQDLRPIDFGGWLNRPHCNDPRELTFWIEYWIAAFTHLLTERDIQPRFLSYGKLCEDPGRVLRGLADVVQIRSRESLLRCRATIRPPTARVADTGGVPPSLLTEAEHLYGQLLRVAIG